MSAGEVIREYHEARQVLLKAEAEEMAKLEGVRDADVRAAKVRLALPQEVVDRYTAAVIAYDALAAEIQERMVAAHEVLGLTRAAGQEVN